MSVASKVRNQPSLKLKKKMLSFASRWRKLEKLSKQISQVQKDKGHRSCLYVESKNKSIHRNREWWFLADREWRQEGIEHKVLLRVSKCGDLFAAQ